MVGTPRGYSTVSDKTRIRDHSNYVGFIKQNSDVQRMGRLQVWIPELGGDPENPSNWITCSYASPFAGATNPTLINNTSQTMTGSQQSYGMWMIPPDLENQVLLCFVNGDINRAYWFACIYQQNMNHMIPGIACNVSTINANNTYLPPVVEYNKINVNNPNDPLRPPFTPLANGLVTEGLEADPERGPSSTSARREAPSKVFGFLTPRGNTMHVDDNPENEFIRIRTRSGTQILVDETTGMVYINSKLGNSWLEVSDSGIDIYSSNSVSIRAQQDFNVRADRNIIFDAGGNILLKAATDVNIQSGNNIIMGSDNQLILSSTGNASLTVSGGNLGLSISGNYAIQTGGNLTELSGGNIIREASQILDNSGTAPTVAANPAKVPQPKSLPDVENSSTSTLETIVSRMPTHEPWSGHPHIGVPLEPGEANTATGPQGSAWNGATMGSTTVQTGTGSTKITQNIQPGCAPPGATSGRYAIKVPPTSYDAIKTASSQTGANFGTLMAISNVESGFQSGAAAGTTSASGLFQVISGTWNGIANQYGSQYNISTISDTNNNAVFDPTQNAMVGALYANQNTAALQKEGISNPSTGDLYLTHMLGTGGGSELISAVNSNPNAPISSLPSGTYQNILNNPGWLRGSYTGSNLGSDPTIGDYYNNLTGYMNQLAGQYNQAAGLPDYCTQTGTSPGSSSAVIADAGATSTGAPVTGHA